MNFLSFIFLLACPILSFSNVVQIKEKDLSETKLGQAIVQGDFSVYEKELARLMSHRSYEYAVKTLSSVDSEGNNILHLMVLAEGPEGEKFAREIPRLIILLEHMQIQPLSQVNQFHSTPRETALRVENSLAVQYLSEAENASKFTTQKIQSLQSGKKEEEQKDLAGRALTSAMLAVYGILFASASLDGGRLDLALLLGAPPIVLGCLETFKAIKKRQSL